MLRPRVFLRLGLHGSLVLWMAAVAVAPLWHADHAGRPAPAREAGHPHHAGAWMCDAAPEIVEPGVDCVLCKAQRHLSQYWSRTHGGPVTLQEASAPASPALDAPRAGARISLASRAPPLC